MPARMDDEERRWREWEREREKEGENEGVSKQEMKRFIFFPNIVHFSPILPLFSLSRSFQSCLCFILTWSLSWWKRKQNGMPAISDIRNRCQETIWRREMSTQLYSFFAFIFLLLRPFDSRKERKRNHSHFCATAPSTVNLNQHWAMNLIHFLFIYKE